MHRRDWIRILPVLAAASLVPAARAQSKRAARERKPDLADVTQGTYHGEVISDSRGATRPDVTLTLTRVGVDRVRITSNYPRLPTVEVELARALDKIVQTRGNTTFFYEWSKMPVRLEVSFDNQVSWSGTKR